MSGEITNIGKLKDVMSLRYTRPRQFARDVPRFQLQLFHRQSIFSLASNPPVEVPQRPFTLKLITPETKKPLVHKFDDASGLDAFVKSFNGSLRGPIPERHAIVSFSKYTSLSPDDTYEISSPYFKAIEQRHHDQVADKAFESKARYALIRHLEEAGIKYQELDGSSKAEMMQMMQSLSGRVYLKLLVGCSFWNASILSMR